MAETHKDLEVWKVSVDFVTELYILTNSFPKSELFGLTSQIRRAAVSIPSNIAEGAARKNTREFIQFLYIALGSLSEIDTQIIIAKNLKYLDDIDKSTEKIKYLRVLLTSLIKALNNKLK
jgi:four helix bundle protein